MKSLRIDPETEKKLRSAARARGLSESEFIRQAISREADAVLGETLDVRLADIVGTVRSRGGRAREPHDAFQRLVKKERARRRS